MNGKTIRIAAAVIPIGVLSLFFIPIIPATIFQCAPSASTCLTNRDGLVSVSYATVHWGSFYAYAYAPTGYFSAIASNLSVYEMLLFVVSPFLVMSLALVSPEIRKAIGRIETR